MYLFVYNDLFKNEASILQLWQDASSNQTKMLNESILFIYDTKYIEKSYMKFQNLTVKY